MVTMFSGLILVMALTLALVKVVTNKSTQITVPLRSLLAPAILTGSLLAWTAVVYPFSSYGDNWAIWPAVVIFPFVVIWHCVIIFKLRGSRMPAFVAALGHLGIFVPLWFGCLMLISKDSL